MDTTTARRVLWVSAHPEPRSLNGSLRTEGLRTLNAAGHEHRESDLYAMDFDPVVRTRDFPAEPAGRLDVAGASQRAYRDGTLSPDIRAEHAKLAWADTLVVQFPLWWYGMPAILKGWFDRVFVKGYGYGVKDPATGRIRRYGDGALAGRRALVVVTVGARGDSIGPRGIHGDIDDVLFPITHGILWYTGMTVLPPLVLDGANRVGADRYRTLAADLRERLRTLATTPPVPFRYEAGGDYDDDLVLRPDRAPRQVGPAIHRATERADLAG
ncbi:MAG TPA: NAD(P)H-dependent oxidoreductase [Actinocatenispora sp.]